MTGRDRRGASGVRVGLSTAVSVMVAASALGACAGVPVSSEVQQGSLVGQAALQPVRVQPEGPPAGASVAQIVRGFLRAGAGAGFENDHATARSFLMRSVRDQWQAGSGVKVYAADSGLKVELLDPSTVRVTAAIVAEVDLAGRYRDTPQGTSAQAVFRMQKSGAGWRISQLPADFGLWLSVSDLERSYRSFTVAYVSEVAQTMVADRRWFPITPGIATTLARAQLDPVPGYLSGAARTGVPKGTRLAVDSVPVQSERAVVDLSASALLATPAMRRAMWAQFVTTLTQAATVSELSLTVAGAGMVLPNTSDWVSAASEVGYQSPTFGVETAILRTGRELRRVAPDRPLDQDPPPRPPQDSDRLPKIPLSWVSLGLSWNGHEIAGISGDHRDLGRWQGGRHLQLARFGAELTRPSYDSMNGLWVAGRVERTAKAAGLGATTGPAGTGTVVKGPAVKGPPGASRVWVVDTSLPMEKARPRVISAPWLANRRVIALKVAADNQRAALITSNPAGGDEQVVVVGIVRSPDGTPVSLAAEPLRVGAGLTSATDLAWVDDSTLALIGRVSPAAAPGPQLVEIGGKVTAMPPVEGARLVTNTGGLRGVVVLTDRGKVLARAGKTWQVLQTGTDFLIPGE